MLDKRKTCYMLDSEKARRRLQEYLQNGSCYPSDVVLHLNTICNHKCDYCYNFLNLKTMAAAADTFNTLAGDRALKLLDELSDCGVEKVIVSGGGEPLLHKDLIRILEKAESCGFTNYLYTNLDSNINNVMEPLLGLDGISVNLNTNDKELYRATRGNGANFDTVRKNLESLVTKGANLAVTIIVRNNTIHTLESTINFVTDLGIKYINVSPAFDLKYNDDLRTTKTSLDEMGRIREKINNKNIRILEPELEAVKDRRGAVVCESHHFNITVGADYGIYPCCAVSYLERYKIVDLGKFRSFSDAWSSEERQRWCRESNVGCRSCWFGPINDRLRKAKE